MSKVWLWSNNIFLTFVVFVFCCAFEVSAKPQQSLTIDQKVNSKQADQKIKDAFDRALSDFWVQSQGEVVKVLKDDLDGNRHQRFLLRLSNGHTVLVAHNIDIAPRIPKLNVRDVVVFYGEYEWNNKGGVIHWTHHDPAGRKTGGWLIHQGRRYE